MYLICFLLFLFLATLLFCIVQNKSPYDQAIDDLAQETVLTQYCTMHGNVVIDDEGLVFFTVFNASFLY